MIILLIFIADFIKCFPDPGNNIRRSSCAYISQVQFLHYLGSIFQRRKTGGDIIKTVNCINMSCFQLFQVFPGIRTGKNAVFADPVTVNGARLTGCLLIIFRHIPVMMSFSVNSS